MGTHPIFESDFDCLTDFGIMNRLLSNIVLRNSTRNLRLSCPAAGNITELGSYEAFSEIVKNAKAENKNLIIDFHAEWCGPCKMLGPILTKVVKADDSVDLLKIDVDEFDELAMDFNVRAMPTV